MISFKDVSVAYNEYTVIEAFNFDIQQGEIVSFFGPSGCGKSTLMKVLLGQLLPFAGSATIKNVNAKDYKEAIAYAPQENQLLPWKNVRENIEIWNQAGNKAGREANTMNVDAVLELIELKEHQNKLPHQLSGGMARRNNLARALGMNSDILFLDEAFVSVENRMKRKLLIQARDYIKHHNITALVISHDYEEAIYLSDRIVVLTGGPTVIKKIVDVKLKNPRTLESFEEDQFENASLSIIH